MCWTKSRRFLQFCLLFCLLSSFCISSLSADVTLTDEEARELIQEIEASEKDLNQAQTELSQLKEELKAVKDTYSEQETYYKERLKEAEQKQTLPWILTGAGATVSTILSVVLLVVLL